MRRGRKRPPDPPDVPAVEKAIRDLLRGAGVEIDGTDLEKTPARVAKAWTESFLDGYRSDPAALFAPEAELERAIRDVIREGASVRAHVFNLGHGIHHATDPDRVALLVDRVHEISGRAVAIGR